MLDSAVLRIRLFQPPSGWLAADEDGERTGDFSKPAALRGLGIAFGLTLTTPSGVRSTPGTTGRSAPLPKLRAWMLTYIYSLGNPAVQTCENDRLARSEFVRTPNPVSEPS